MMREALFQLSTKTRLSESDFCVVLDEILSLEASPSQIGAFLMGLKWIGETSEEISALVRILQDRALRLDLDSGGWVDGCGTGGDAAGTFNISTAASLVAAAAGARVAKHGNRSVSSRCGSADLIEALGIRLEPDLQTLESSMQKHGFGFLFAPRFHPLLKNLGPLRRELGFPTVFNLAAPLANPMRVKRQLVGVSKKDWISRFAEVLQKLGTEHAWVVCGSDGLDEITLTGVSDVAEVSRQGIRFFSLDPKQFGFSLCSLEDLKGKDAEENLKIIEGIFSGEKGPKRDIVVLNAAAILHVSCVAADFEQGIRLASLAIDSGKVTSLVQALHEF